MRTRLYQLLGIVTLGGILLFTSISASAQTNVVADNVELAALKALYDSLGGAGWTTKTNWPTAATWPASATAAQMGTWFGITVVNGDISKITFQQKNLIGKIPSKLGDLKALTVLDLNTNSGITGKLPSTLWTITTLKDVLLYSCNISGTISTSVFTMPNLNTFNLSTNKLTGGIPSNVGSATNLTLLNLSYNALGGTLPTTLGSLTKLQTLLLTKCSLTGSIPTTVGGMTALVQLRLDQNLLTGSIPTEIGSLTKLSTALFLNNNQLSGTIPTTIGNLIQLQNLDLSTNKLTGSIPTTIGSLTKLISLNLSSNLLTGSIPTTIGSLVNMAQLMLTLNNLSGTIPVEIGYLTKLSNLNLSYNQLTGSIPTSIGNLTLLNLLYLHSNKLSGSIPTSIGNLVNLTQLNLNTNLLTGSIPTEIGNLTKLVVLFLQANQLSGALPSTLGNLVNLGTFYAFSNQLTSVIPNEIGNLTKLTNLQLHVNQLSGSIPSSIGNLVNLSVLYLYSNQLTGNLPPQIGNLTNLTQLALNLNQFTGNIPPQLGNLTNLTNLHLYNNFLTGSIPSSLGNLTKLTAVNFNNNQLSGVIPASLSAWSLVQSVSLGGNQLSGEVPANLFTTWTKATYIMLGPNQLTGTLPSSITNCQLLTNLYINNNQFTALPPSFLTLPNLTLVYLNDNELKAIPNFSTYSNKANLGVFVQNNRLDFSNLEWLGNSSGIKGRTFAPLKNINDFLSVGYKAGNPLVIQARPPGLNSTITWEKQNANGTWTVVNSLNQDATQKTFTRNISAPGDQGFYRWRMTNTVIGGYTLYSEPIYAGELSSTEQTKTLYNGLITAASWRTDKAYGTNGSDLTGMYLYDYDEKYQLKEAVFANPNFTTSRYTYTLAGNNYRLSGMEYDPNGNIQKLKRFKDNGQIQHDFGYTYATNTNQLTKVSSYADYSYNAIGQTTKVDKVVNTDSEKDQYIDYDVTGKVVAVFTDVDKKKPTTRYTYDDRGFRLTKSDYDANGALTKTFWYIRDASGNVLSIYEQTGVEADQFTNFKQTEVPIYGAGKLATYYPIVSVAANEDGVDAGSTAYEITDHLGNVRAIIRTQTNEYTATMEDDGTPTYTNPRVKENVYFKNLVETQKRDPQMNHTSSMITAEPSMSSYLYWITGAQNGITPDKKSVGPAIALNVSPGDQLDLNAWARFKIKTSYTKAPIKSIVAGALASNFAFTNGLETLTQATSTFNAGLLGLVSTTEAETNRPYAYLNYLVFNSSNVVVEGKALRVPLSAGFEEAQRGSGYTQNNLVKFDTPITINQTGYIYVWVSNESENTEVWFDDVSIMHHKPLVAQATDYGAWGEVLREQKWVDLDAKYRYGYQGKYAEKDDETGWNHFELREYDPVIGRWTTKDPKGQYYSPYVAMGNNPISGVDPDGGKDWFVNEQTGELLEAPGKRADYAKTLGKGWAWLAPDFAFNVPKSLYHEYSLFGGDAAEDGSVGYRAWTYEESVELMKHNDMVLAPQEILRFEDVRFPVNQVTPSGPVSVRNVTSDEIWLKLTYVGKDKSVLPALSVLWSKEVPGGYQQVLKIKNTFYDKNSFVKGSRKAVDIYDKLGTTSAGLATPSIYLNWKGYSPKGILNNFKK